MVARIERKLGRPYLHGRVAETLMRDQAAIVPTLYNETLGRFETLFERLNATLD